MATKTEAIQQVIDQVTAKGSSATAEELIYLAKAIDTLNAPLTSAEIVGVGTAQKAIVTAEGVAKVAEISSLGGLPSVAGHENKTLKVTSGAATWEDVTATLGGDLSGTTTNAQIIPNAVGVIELNVTDGTSGQTLTTNGSGTLSFATPSGGSIFEPNKGSNSVPLSTAVKQDGYIHGNTNSYGWMIQRTTGTAADTDQFALINGFHSSANGTCKGIILPFQIKADNSLVVGTRSDMFTNTSSGSDFSTCQLIQDKQSGCFHYSGNIPWVGGSHYSGFGTGRLRPDNTADYFTNTTYGSTVGLHGGNRQIEGLTTADGLGYRGVMGGYTNSDSKSRIHGIDHTSPTSVNVTSHNPSADTSTCNPICTFKREGSNTGNQAISGGVHFRQSNNAQARIFAANGAAYTDFQSNKAWDVDYSSGPAPAVELSNGKTLVYHTKSNAYCYNNHSSRTSVSATYPPFISGSPDWITACAIPDGTDAWLVIHPSLNIVTIARWKIDPSTYAWSKTGVSKFVSIGESGSFMRLNALKGNRIMIMFRASEAQCNFIVLDRPDLT